MKHIIIIKRIEPYDLIEGIKKNFSVEDFTFIGMNKFEVLEKIISKMSEIQNEQTAFGLYMKNVNKFYLVTSDKSISEMENLINKNILENILNIEPENIKAEEILLTESRDNALTAVDMGKAEASIFIS